MKQKGSLSHLVDVRLEYKIIDMTERKYKKIFVCVGGETATHTQTHTHTHTHTRERERERERQIELERERERERDY